MKKLFEMLGLEKLDNSIQEEVKAKIETLIDAKADEKVSGMVETKIVSEKEKLVSEYEEKFEEYKEDITSKFSNFVDSIIEEELEIPEKVLEYAHRGELYSELIEQFKIRLAIDEGLLDNEVRSILAESKDTIVSLKEDLNKSICEKLDLEVDCQKMANNIQLRTKCDGLTEAHRQRVMSILGDSSVEDVNSKFDLVVETTKIEKTNEEEDVKEIECPECGVMVAIKGDKTVKCPECGTVVKKGSKVEVDDDDDEKEKKEKKEVKEEVDSPFSQSMVLWKNMLKGDN